MSTWASRITLTRTKISPKAFFVWKQPQWKKCYKFRLLWAFCNASKDKKKRTKDPVSNFKDTFRVEYGVCISRNYASLTLHIYSLSPYTPYKIHQSEVQLSIHLTSPHLSCATYLWFFSILIPSTPHTPHAHTHSTFNIRLFGFLFSVFQPLERVPPRWGVKVLWNFNNDKL